jgi:hypothetical protein
MRTTRAAILIIVFAFSMSSFACNDGTGPTPTPEPKPTPTPVATVEPTATATGEPVPTPTPTATTVIGYIPDIQIIDIYYKGRKEVHESNEYVVIKNYDDRDFNLYGWTLVDITDGYPTFTFPHFVLERGEMVRVYTNEKHPYWEEFSFGSEDPVWNNTHPDMAALYNSRGELVSNASYEIF